MSLTAALQNSLSGLRSAQAGIDVVSRNVANATTPGYTRKVSAPESRVDAGQGTGVQRAEITRVVDERVLRDLQMERGRTAELDVLQTYLGRLDQSFGRPEDEASIASSVNRLSTALAALADMPEDTAAQRSAVTAADQLARDLNRASDGVQQLRQDADDAIRDDVEAINSALAQIEDLNREISARERTGRSAADLLDQRDTLVGDIAEHLDIQTYTRAGNELVIMTGSGRTLLDVTARTLAVEARGPVTAEAVYDPDPAKRGVGAIVLVDGETRTDLLARDEIAGGSLAGYVALRDRLLPQAQEQLDELAHQLALGLSGGTVGGSPVERTTAATLADGVFPFDGAGDTQGNTIAFTVDGVTYTTDDLPLYTGTDPDGADAAVETAIRAALDEHGFTDIAVSVAPVGGEHVLTFTDPQRRALTGLTITGSADAGTPVAGAAFDPAQTVDVGTLDVGQVAQPGDSVTVTWRDPATEQARTITLQAVSPPATEAGQFVPGATPESTADTIVRALDGLLPDGLQVTLAGTTLTFTDADVGPNTPSLIDSATTSRAAESGVASVFADGRGDAQIGYTGVGDTRGFAQRIAIDETLLAEPQGLVLYPVDDQGTPSDSGDPTRPLDLLDQLTRTLNATDPDAGFGGRPMTIENLATAIVSFQAGQAADQADRHDFQVSVTEALERRFDERSGVNIDEEMSELLLLEQSYNASSQILTAVQTMYDSLFQALR